MPEGRPREIDSPVRQLGLHLLVAVVLALAVTWPMPLHLSDRIATLPTDADVQAGLWWPSAFADAVLSGHGPFFRHELAWPLGQDTRLLLWNFLPQLLFLPIHALTDPLVGLHLANYATVVLNALAAGWAAGVVTKSRLGALAGVVVGATNIYAWSEGEHGRPEQALWAPIAVYLGALWDRRVRLAGVMLGLAGATYWFYAYFLVLLTLVWGVVRREWRIVPIGALSAVVALPFLGPVISAMLEARTSFEVVRDTSANVWDTQSHAALALPMALLWPLERVARQPTLLAPLLMVPIALWRRGPFGWVTLAAVLLACGPLALRTGPEPWRVGGGVVYMPHAALDLLPGFSRFWWPYRWLGVAVPAFAIVVGQLVAARPRWFWPLVALLGFEASLMLRHTGPFDYVARPPAALLEIARAPHPAPILQLPTTGVVNGFVGWQAFHGQPVDGGLALQLPSLRRKLGIRVSRLQAALERVEGPDAVPLPEAWTEADTEGFRYVVLYNVGKAGAYKRRVMQISSVLGEPFVQDEQATAWSIPGVSTAP